MGLGKTVQTLAHFGVEKAARRLKCPSLLIAPTSLVHNWSSEAKRFCPNLSILVLHGANRKEQYSNIKKADIVITTYPLVMRDKAILLTHDFYYIVLDEAQAIKNAKAKSTQVILQLSAKHRICLTGTPMENHLGELWSLYNFVLPGLLGSSKQFKTLFRTPIERHGDALRYEQLANRIKPFLLRRRKDDVLKELPPKTEIIRHIEIEGAQRDLYETIRLSMEKKVRDAIHAKGMARSQIMILDALLKLRQICCAPSLLKLKTIQQAIASAKLDDLMNFLPSLIEEGRQVLLFSSFTSMLALIEAQLNERSIGYVKLTGQTRDRQTPIERFQNAEVPLFLISLKAGGVGLNLTAADTVIHYDPWWNPAAEQQATDRAHRIGQTKPVFVYKLITKGTVEEKILQMQNKKKALISGVIEQKHVEKVQLTPDDLNFLFQPLS
jgi:SNF2 family DNA or RNA helicase